jgi:hypothetical protein
VPQPSKAIVLAKTKGRSRLTNGHHLPRGVDLRSPWARRFRDLLVIHIGDRPECSEAERAIIRRAATLIVSLERMEERFAKRGDAHLDELETYQRCSNTMKRLLEAVGLQRRAKTVNAPNLSQYLRRRSPSHRATVIDAEVAEDE